jgi:hypothetical protein
MDGGTPDRDIAVSGDRYQGMQRWVEDDQYVFDSERNRLVHYDNEGHWESVIGGWRLFGDAFSPQGTNPNCFQNAVAGSPGIGKFRIVLPSGPNLNSNDPNDFLSHDGGHALSGAELPIAKTLAPLIGTVIAIVPQDAKDPKTLWNVYVKADGKISGQGFYIAYKDFPSRQSITAKQGQHLGVGDIIGTVRPPGDPADERGLHITLVRAQYWQAYRNDKVTKAAQGRQMESGIRRYWIIDPNSTESPINCLR